MEIVLEPSGGSHRSLGIGLRGALVFDDAADTRVAVLLDGQGVGGPPPAGEVPAIWSLAPTGVALAIPMLFQSGRRSLRVRQDRAAACNRKPKQMRIQDLREVLAAGLEGLLHRGRDWSRVAAALGLDGHSTHASFFASLWSRMRTTFDWHKEAPGSAAKTVHDILWSENPPGALRRLAQAGGVPDSLRRPARLLRAEQVQFVRSGAVSAPEVFDAVAELAGLEDEFVVDDSVKTTLEKIGGRAIRTVDLQFLFERWAQRTRWRCSPQDAIAWSSAEIDWRLEHQGNGTETAAEDIRATQRHLPSEEFQGADGSWQAASAGVRGRCGPDTGRLPRGLPGLHPNVHLADSTQRDGRTLPTAASTGGCRSARASPGDPSGRLLARARPSAGGVRTIFKLRRRVSAACTPRCSCR